VNDLPFVLRAVDLLWLQGVRTWICGGWAEELRGLAPVREHPDLDLLYPARDWSRVDHLDLEWVTGKRFPWKRAFVLDGIVVELVLVERDEHGTWFTGASGRRHVWPADTFAANGRLPVASAAALTGYRGSYRRAA
jgi:hypothetical protein